MEGASSQLRYVGQSHSGRPILPLSSTIGILGGTEQSSILHEIKRSHNADAALRRRTAALLAGFFTLLVLGGSGYLLAESIVSVVNFSRPGVTVTTQRKVISFIEVGMLGFPVVATLLTIPYLRFRRPTKLAQVVITLDYITFMLQTAATILSGAFIYVWSSSVRLRCKAWALDVAWYFPEEATCTRPANGSLNGYLIAAGMRLLVVLIVGSIWLYLLHRFSRLMPLAGDRLDQETVESLNTSEAIREVLQRHNARLVVLADGDVLATSDETQLPSMPQERVLSEAEQAKEAEPPSLLGRLVSNVAWFFGLSKAGPETADFTRADASSPLLPMTQWQGGSAPLSQQSSRFSNNPLHPDYQPYEAPLSGHLAQPSLPPTAAGSSTAPAASGSPMRPTLSSQTPSSYLPAFPTFFKGHGRTGSDKAASVPLVAPTQPSSPERDAGDAYGGIDTSWREYDSQESEDMSMDRSDDELFRQRDLSSSSAHSVLLPLPASVRHEKQQVYVQMSDGHLVRKLSTIRSEGTGEISRSASLESSSIRGSHQDLPGNGSRRQLNGRRSREQWQGN